MLLKQQHLPIFSVSIALLLGHDSLQQREKEKVVITIQFSNVMFHIPYHFIGNDHQHRLVAAADDGQRPDVSVAP